MSDLSLAEVELAILTPRRPPAVQVNIETMRAFVRLRRILSGHQESRYDQQFRSAFEAIRQFMTPPVSAKNPIGCTAKIPSKE